MRALVVVSVLTLALAEGHVGYWNSANNLQPVKGLYVKPSLDGTTGDLYVAATEDSGAKTQWLTETPLNFLPPAAASTPTAQFTQTSSLTTLPHDEAIATNQKRAILATPPFKFNYAAPVNDGKTLPFNYAYAPSPLAAPAAATENKECSKPENPAVVSYGAYAPYHYYYPQMMAALLNGIKDTGARTEEGNPNVQQGAIPYWPQAYTYPIQYVMVNPAAWAQAQATQSSPIQTAASATSIQTPVQSSQTVPAAVTTTTASWNIPANQPISAMLANQPTSAINEATSTTTDLKSEENKE